MQNTIKYIIKTDNDRTYMLYIMNAPEYNIHKETHRYIGLFLFYDDDVIISNPDEMWMHLKHRLLFENSIEAVKDKVIEYSGGRNEKIIFLEVPEHNLVM